MATKSIRTIIIDDDKDWLTLLEVHVKAHPKLDLIGSFTTAMAAYNLITEGEVDLILLDIEMPDLNGIEFINLMKNMPPVIFITSHAEFALKSYEVNALDYLLKPITTPRFLQAIEKLILKQSSTLENSNSDEGAYFFIRENSLFVKIQIDKVLYLKSMENYTQIVTNEQIHTTLLPLSTVEEQLPNDVFQRVHRSYVVNMSKITSVNASEIFINKVLIPLSQNYSQKIMDRLVKGYLLTRETPIL
jgi:DNA-binding LytR/AlgR family response regulator